MANHFLSRVIPKTLRSLTTTTVSSSLRHLRPLSAASLTLRILTPNSTRTLSTRATTSSLNDPNPNWSNRPPKETILLDGCDFEHWLIVMDKPQPHPVTGEPTRDEIIASYIRTLAHVVGSEEEARMKIYSVSTRNYFAFGALVSEELSIKIKELPNVRWVLPDSYLNVREKDYGGEPFINGEAVPYDPKYHEEWVRNNARANERNKRNDRPRNADRSRNFDRRRENVVNRDMNTRPPPTPHAQISGGGYPPNNGVSGGGYPPNNAGSGGGFPPNNAGSGGGYPPNNAGSGGGFPPNNAGSGGGFPPNNARGYPPNNSGGYGIPNSGGFAPQNSGGYAPNNNRSPSPNSGYSPAVPPNAGWSNHQNFAKRQLTWFRNERIYHWLDASKPLETILNFIHDAYHDRNGNLVVPKHLRMSRDISSPRVAARLKAYRTRNRHFVNGEDCYPILEWIKKTQK